jgi:hypothetical protein
MKISLPIRIVVTVDVHRFYPGRPSWFSGPPDNWAPAEGPEIEFELDKNDLYNAVVEALEGEYADDFMCAIEEAYND